MRYRVDGMWYPNVEQEMHVAQRIFNRAGRTRPVYVYLEWEDELTIHHVFESEGNASTTDVDTIDWVGG